MSNLYEQYKDKYVLSVMFDEFQPPQISWLFDTERDAKKYFIQEISDNILTKYGLDEQFERIKAEYNEIGNLVYITTLEEDVSIYEKNNEYDSECENEDGYVYDLSGAITFRDRETYIYRMFLKYFEVKNIKIE